MLQHWKRLEKIRQRYAPQVITFDMAILELLRLNDLEAEKSKITSMPDDAVDTHADRAK